MSNELNQKLVNEVTKEDVKDAVNALKNEGKLTEELTSSNYQEHVTSVAEKVAKKYSAMDTYRELGEATITGICAKRAKGLMRYIIACDSF